MKEFKGTKGNWKHTKIANEKIEGADSSKILGVGYDKVIGTINATHKEEGYANLKLITKAPEMLRAMNELVIELDRIHYLLPKENEEDGNLIWDRIQTCRSLIKNILKQYYQRLLGVNIYNIMRKKHKKPKILKLKIEICAKLRKKIVPYEISNKGYRWTYYQASYIVGDFNITVYYQKYVRNIFKVDYINIYDNNNFNKKISKTKLIELNDFLENEYNKK